MAGALLAVGGCTAGSPNEAAPASTSSGHASAPAQDLTTASPSSGSPAAAAAPAPVAGACPASTTSAKIGGAATCLAPGQACTKLNRDEYPVYGFLCLPDGAQYVLKRK
jgi:hypothetical protein